MKDKIVRLFLGFFIVFGIFFLLFSPYPFEQSFLVMFGLMLGLWVFSLYLKDSSIVDIFWGLGFVMLGAYYLFSTETITLGNVFLMFLIGIWGIRLTLHIGKRNWGKPEDYRYQEFRRQAGTHYWWFSFFKVFLLQGIILWILSSLFFIAFLNTHEELVATDYIGLILWVIGLFFEAVGDWQLEQFKKDPKNKGKLMDKGLWRYTRHPNYFGDAMVWWGFFAFTLHIPEGWYYIFCPLFMTFLLRYVSGVAMLEENLIQSKPNYKDYVKRTSAFFPLPPKKK